MSHEKVEKNVGLLTVLIILVISVGGLIEIVPLMLSAAKKQGITHVTPRTALAAGRIRYLCARGMLSVPLATDSALPQRDRTLRTVFRGGRIPIRPPVRIRLQAHGPGSGARGRPLQR